MQDHAPTPAELGLTIYDTLENHPQAFLPKRELESVLRKKLLGLKLDQPIRTRSKVVKTAICEALGYPVPRSFFKTQPRFPGQDFDVYVQKSDNLQIWNEELSASRRYVLVRVNENDWVTTVRVVTGQQLAKLDTTGTLTRKYQASAIEAVDHSRLVSPNDTPDLMYAMQEQTSPLFRQLLPINLLYVKLQPILGLRVENPGADQERNRGWALQEAVSKKLGINIAEDDGQVPDVTPQLLELKLQTSPTVDLGLISPGSEERLVDVHGLRFADIRYGLFYATPIGNQIRIDHMIFTTGADFFCFFKQLQGNVVNSKNQIRLPTGFFD